MILWTGDVIQIIGEPGSGKSELMMNITAECVLPRYLNGKLVEGGEMGVAYISTDKRMDVHRLVALLKGKSKTL